MQVEKNYFVLTENSCFTIPLLGGYLNLLITSNFEYCKTKNSELKKKKPPFQFFKTLKELRGFMKESGVTILPQ
jgi:hypothetical protein